MSDNHLATMYWHKLCQVESELVRAMRQIRTLRQEAQDKDKVIARQTERILRLEEENRRLRGTAAKLREIVFKEEVNKKGKESGAGQGGGGGRGARVGHRASFRRKPEEKDITRETQTLLTACPGCDAPLGTPASFTERFSYDIALPTTPVITRHKIARYHCVQCGKWVQGLPRGLVPKSPFGLRLMMLVLHMKYRGKATDDYIQESFRHLYSLHLADGTVHRILDRAARLFGPHYEAIRQAIREGKKVHADETGWRIEGHHGYAWGFANERVIYYTIEETRGSGVPKRVLKGFRGVLIRDGHLGYDPLKNEQQLCWIHLLRHSHQAAGMEDASEEMKDLHHLLTWFLRQARKRHRKCRSPDERLALHQQMSLALERLWKGKTCVDPAAEKIRHWWLEKRHARLLTFLKYEGVSWNNNEAERALRPLVVRRKMTGGSRSQHGARIEAINMSCLSTLIKQGKPLFDEIPGIFREGLRA